MTIWLTRPAADSATLADALQPMETILAPLMDIAPCDIIVPPQTPDALLLTSRHAAHALRSDWSHLPVYCVGSATAEMARAHGFNHVIVGEGDVLSLLPAIADTLKQKTLLYLSGEDVSVDVTALLASQSVTVQRVVTYRAVAATQLAPEIIATFKNNRLTGAVFYSARTAEIANVLLTRAELTEAVRNTDAYCLSLAVAEKAAALPWKRIHVAHIPTAEAMQAMIRTHHRTN